MDQLIQRGSKLALSDQQDGEIEPAVTMPDSPSSSLDLEDLAKEERRSSLTSLGNDSKASLIAANSVAVRFRAALEDQLRASSKASKTTVTHRSETYKEVKAVIAEISRAEAALRTRAESILLLEAKRACRAAYIAKGIDGKVQEASDLVTQHLSRLQTLYEQQEANRAAHMDVLEGIETKHSEKKKATDAAFDAEKKWLEAHLKKEKVKQHDHEHLRRNIEDFVWA